jgi:hypothetical protein
MPLVPFSALPDASRVWIFGSDPALSRDSAARLLADVDDYLAQWKAHGVPLTCARDWSHDRFLTIGVDTTQESASGCSIDGLFRRLQGLERVLDARLLAGGRVFYRGDDGRVRAASREEFGSIAASGEASADTPVFDTTVTTAGDRRARFETTAGASWVGRLLVAPR